MPRTQTYKREDLAAKTLTIFWQSGYHATSMDDLVHQTGVSRHGFYKEFGSKRDALLEAFDLYQKSVVTPAFQRVEYDEASLKDIAAYFEHQISAAEEIGLPGPGCFVANSATEIAPHDTDVKQKIDHHHARLRRGFRNALRNSFKTAPDDTLNQYAGALLVFATGLWTLSRVTSDATSLRKTASTFLELMEGELT